MSDKTTNLGLVKPNATTDTNTAFNLDTFLNGNWEKIDEVIGLLSSLNTTDKTSLVNAINEVLNNEGTLSSLTTTTKTNLVAALNELVTSLSEKANKGTPTEYDLPLASGYTSTAAKYSKDEFNRILLTLHDLRKSDGSVFTGGIIGQLPSGFIPSRYFFGSSLIFVDNGGSLLVVTSSILVSIDGTISITIKNPSNYSITRCSGQIMFQI